MGSVTLLILLDLSAAFDTIDHGVILDRLAGLGVGGTVLRWFHSFLAHRVQRVVLEDSCSAPWRLCHGVPQGSILSPMRFNIYMKPLGEVIRRFGLRSQQYAEDTRLYLSFSTNPGEAVSVLNSCLDLIMDWMRVNKLKLNPAWGTVSSPEEPHDINAMGQSNCPPAPPFGHGWPGRSRTTIKQCPQLPTQPAYPEGHHG